MAEQPQILTFKIEGRADLLTRAPAPPVPSANKTNDAKGNEKGGTADQQRVDATTAATQPSSPEFARDIDQALGTQAPHVSQQAVNALNWKSNEIARSIENEISSMLRGAYTVHASIQFRSGSILLAGTIVLINWLGSAVFESITDELHKQIGEIVKTSVQKVMSLVLNSDRLSGLFKPMDVAVHPQFASTRTGADGQASASTGKRSSSSASTPILPEDRYLRWILIGIVAVLVLQGVMWLDQRFTFALRSSIPNTTILMAPTATVAPTVP